MKELSLYNLTNAQKRVWYSEILFPDTSLSNIGFKIIIKKSINLEVLKQSIQMFVYSEETMRVRLKNIIASEPLQYVSEYKPINIPVYTEEDLEPYELNDWLVEESKKPLELYDNELFKFIIVNLKSGETILFIKFHHIIIDGISTTIATKKIMEIYDILVKDRSFNPDIIPLSYLESDDDYKKSNRYEKDRKFWIEEFKTLPEYLDERTSKLYSNSTSAGRMEYYIPRKLQTKMEYFCKEFNISINALLTAIPYLYYYKINNYSDIIVGTNFANRSNSEKNSLGMFVSTTPFRMGITPTQDVISFLNQVKNKQTKLLRHYRYPYNNLLQELRGAYKYDVKQLYTIAVEYQELSMDDPDIYYEGVFAGEELNEFYLHFKKRMDTKEIYLHLDYRVDLYDREKASGIINNLFVLLNDIIDNPNKKIFRIEYYR